MILLMFVEWDPHNPHDLEVYSTCFLGVDMYDADHAQPLTMAGEELVALQQQII